MNTSVSVNPLKKGLISFRGHDLTIMVFVVCGILISLAVYSAVGNQIKFPQAIIDAFPFADWVNEGRVWLEANFRVYTRAMAAVVEIPLLWLEEKLWEMPWLFVTMILMLPALAYGGVRLGLITFIGIMFWGMVDMWYEAMSTLSLMTCLLYTSPSPRDS